MSDFLNKFKSDNEQNIMDDNINLDIDEEIVASDEEFLKKQRQKRLYFLLGGIGALILAIGLFIWLSLVRIPDFNNKNINYAKNWAQDMQININVEKEYDNVIDENMIIQQDLNPGSLVFKNKYLNLVVSQGADPEQEVSVPNLKGMHLNKVNEWIEANKLDNVTIESVSSKSIGEGFVISYDFDENFVSRSNFKRKNSLVIKVSTGKQTAKKNIIVPNFRVSDKYEVQIWAEENKVNIEYIYQSHPKYEKDQIIKQSVKKGKKIAKNSWISVWVSLGKGAKVPDFSKMSKENAQTYRGVNVNVKSVFHPTKKYGKFIKQTIKPGTTLYSGKKTTIYYSEGRPFIDDLKTYTRKQVDEYFYKLNKKMYVGQIYYKVHYTNSGVEDIDSELVYKVTRGGDSTSAIQKYVNVNETIHVYIKKSK